MPNDTVYIYGDIGSAYWYEGIGANEVMAMLRELDSTASCHHIRINSPGGLVSDGLTITNLLLAHTSLMRQDNPDFVLKTHCDGYAMSAASLIFMAGTERSVSLGGILMIHDALAWSTGNAETLRKEADNLDVLSASAADIYSKRCVADAKRNPEYFRKLMKAETYMTGDTAIEHGLATCQDISSEAVLCSEFSPEKLRGHYAELMTTKRVRTTMQRPVELDKLRSRTAAMALLKKTMVELGMKDFS